MKSLNLVLTIIAVVITIGIAIAFVSGVLDSGENSLLGNDTSEGLIDRFDDLSYSSLEDSRTAYFRYNETPEVSI